MAEVVSPCTTTQSGLIRTRTSSTCSTHREVSFASVWLGVIRSRRTSGRIPKSSTARVNSSRCWPVRQTAASMASSRPRHCRSTGASLMASGRVPKISRGRSLLTGDTFRRREHGRAPLFPRRRENARYAPKSSRGPFTAGDKMILYGYHGKLHRRRVGRVYQHFQGVCGGVKLDPPHNLGDSGRKPWISSPNFEKMILGEVFAQ